eukprot:TRINITY_DN10388_c0_g1_i14.p1 TRINITY_DN10388_c0_g1~~TRINITY_DN10388_c0_g1_i14.p1  ORF type:complete len:392 (+),score=89.10 TRINITY_DN10388_c0_g1_i14:97-1272(+)
MCIRDSYQRVEDNGKATAFLDQGPLGHVPLMKNLLTNSPLTMKIIEKAAVRDMGEVRKKIRQHRRLVHENVLKLQAVIETKNTLTLMLEQAKHGTLRTVLKTENHFTESKAFSYFVQMCNGLNFLQKHGLTHYKLDAHSVLFTGFNEVKLCGFDYFYQVAKNSQQLSEADYNPPESEDSEKANIWRLGIILYEMIHGHVPFKDKIQSKLLGRVVHKQLMFRSKIKEDLKDIITWMLSQDPEFRPTLAELLAHKWLLRMGRSSSTITQPKGEETVDLALESEMEIRVCPIEEISEVDEDAYPIHKLLEEDSDSPSSDEENPEIPLHLLYNYGQTREELETREKYLDMGKMKTSSRVSLYRAKSLVERTSVCSLVSKAFSGTDEGMCEEVSVS